MKKKFLVTTLAAITATTCAFGFSACGDKEITGDEVTEEQWKAAFLKNMSSTNYTLNAREEYYVDCSVLGSRFAEDAYYNYDTLKWSSAHIITEHYFEINEGNGKVSSNKKDTSDIKYNPSANKSDEKTVHIYEEYSQTDSNDSWFCTNGWKEGEWSVLHESGSMGYWYNLHLRVRRTIEESEQYIDDLYSAFTFKNGVYSAKFCNYIAPIDAVYEGSISLKFKDGYIIEMISDWGYEDKYSTNPTGGRTVLTLEFSNFGNTSVSVPAGALEAIEKEKNKN